MSIAFPTISAKMAFCTIPDKISKEIYIILGSMYKNLHVLLTLLPRFAIISMKAVAMPNAGAGLGTRATPRRGVALPFSIFDISARR